MYYVVPGLGMCSFPSLSLPAKTCSVTRKPSTRPTTVLAHRGSCQPNAY